MPDPNAPQPGLTYGAYLCVPQLLELQRPRSTPGHPDELLFIVSHQVYELWFKQMLHELERIARHLDADEPLRAAELFDRVHRIQHLLTQQIPLLETMFAADFAKFRAGLATGSGFQSVQFRKIEFLCGKKNAKMIAAVGDDAAEKAGLEEYLSRPTPYDHFLRHLSREDNRVFPVPQRVLARDTSKPHELDEECVSALETLYRLREQHHAGERYYAQFRVCEHLLEFDERFSIWRFHHVKMVERMIGAKTGTGGSSGAKYLAGTVPQVFYPDIWAVRDRLGGASPGSDGAPRG